MTTMVHYHSATNQLLMTNIHVFVEDLKYATSDGYKSYATSGDNDRVSKQH